MEILANREIYISRFPPLNPSRSLSLSLSLGKSLIFGEILRHYVYDALATDEFNELIFNSIGAAENRGKMQILHRPASCIPSPFPSPSAFQPPNPPHSLAIRAPLCVACLIMDPLAGKIKRKEGENDRQKFKNSIR